jgi:hypothetical protein
MRRALILSALLALTLPAAAQDNKDKGGAAPVPQGGGLNPPPYLDQSKIDKAIERGIAYLMANNASHMTRFEHVKRQMQHTELVLWTYVHADVKETDPNFQALLKDMLDRKLETTYCTALQAMILEEVQRVKYQPRIWQCGQFLVDNQSADGFWGYGDPTIYAEDPPGTPTTGNERKEVASGVKKAGAIKEMDSPLMAQPGMRVKPAVKGHLKVEKKRDGNPNDQSNSQYAALGLRACHDAGIDIPPAVVDKAIAWWKATQKAADGEKMKLEFRDSGGKPVSLAPAAKGQSGVMERPQEILSDPRGWCYGKHDHKAYGSMTAGAIGTLAIYDYIKDNDQGKKRSWRSDKDVISGIAWIAKNFSVTYNPGPYEHANFAENSQSQYYYYLYALERAGMLFGTELVGTHWWYAEGAKVLIDAQKGTGAWGGGTVDTCFAILFLKRATRPLDGVVTESAAQMRARLNGGK